MVPFLYGTVQSQFEVSCYKLKTLHTMFFFYSPLGQFNKLNKYEGKIPRLISLPSMFHVVASPTPTVVSSLSHYIFLPPYFRGSNSRALKIAILTTLACLLLASQVFTAYMVFDQKQQIHTLQRNSERMRKQLTRASHGKNKK